MKAKRLTEWEKGFTCGLVILETADQAVDDIDSAIEQLSCYM